METAEYNIELYELSEIEKLSTRSQNVCEWNNLNDILSILNFYWNNKDFLKLRNCGQKSNDELILICKKYENSKFIVKPPINHQTELDSQFNNLTFRQKSFLNNVILLKFDKLSIRSRNALTSYLDNTINIESIQKNVFSYKKFNVNNIRNIGKTSIDEVLTFFDEIKSISELITLYDDDEIKSEYFVTYLIQNYKTPEDHAKWICSNFDFNLGFPIFKTIHYLNNGSHLFDPNETFVFQHLCNFYLNKTSTLLAEYSAELNLSSERIRQIRIKLLKKLPNCIRSLFTYDFEYKSLYTYGISQNDNFIIFDDDIVNQINKYELVNFNHYFISYVFSILLKETHTLIGNAEDAFLNKTTKQQHYWQNLYLIKNNISWKFDFNKFFSDVYNRITSKIVKDYKFHFHTYLLNFKHENCYDILDLISEVCETILIKEFEIFIDAEGYITFNRNVNKPISEYICEILEEKNEPLTIYEIYKLLIQKYPNLTKSPESLRSSCQRDPNLIYFGRSSTYGLKSWEKANIVKGGTMHDISEEYLTQFDVPKHIDEVAKYVSNYRDDVTSKNLLYNLKSAEKRRFVFFKNYHIGLASKTYNEDFPKIDKASFDIKTWDESFSMLEEFVTKYNHLPNSTGIDFEKKLYRFLNLQLRKADNAEIDAIKAQKIRTLVNLYDYHKRTRRNPKNIHQSYDELKSFIAKYKRVPKARDYEEMNLYHFFYKQTTLYKSGDLPNELLVKYLEIIKLIQT